MMPQLRSSRFISTPAGFRYLYDANYIDREMDTWFHVSVDIPVLGANLSITKERNLRYVVQVEVYLAKVFNSGNLLGEGDDLSCVFLCPVE